MTHALLLLVVLVLSAFAVWTVLTWWFADAQPAFGKPEPGRVTYKAVVQNALRDLRDLLKLDVAARWLTNNALGLAVLASGVYQFADPVLRQALLSATWHGVPVGAVGIAVVLYLAQIKRA